LRFFTDDGIVVVVVRRSTPNVAAAPRLMTVDDYFNTPETLKPMELAFGVLRVAESPSPRHQSAVGDFFLALDAHVRARQLGRMWLSPLDVVADRRPGEQRLCHAGGPIASDVLPEFSQSLNDILAV
jgi:hypothetical protein